MKVTIQKIAEAAGVSRGTEDRALNNRGRIDPQVSERILRIADEMGYVPRSRRQTASRGKPIKIGVVTQLAGSSFMLEVNRGIQKAASELREKNIELILKEGMTVDEKEQLRFIEELESEGISGLAVMPVDCESVREKLESLSVEKKIPVVTFNSDIVGSKRLCFVGMDNRKSGRTAAGLLGMLTRGKAFEKLKLDKRPYVVIYDQTPKNEKALKDNTVDFLIDQNGYVQGHKPPLILADLLLNGKTQKKEFLFTDIIIKTKYNL